MPKETKEEAEAIPEVLTITMRRGMMRRMGRGQEVAN
jgi:hypothetical protein